MPSDSDWITLLAFLLLESTDGRTWDFLATIIKWANSYKKNLFICISLPCWYCFLRKLWLTQHPSNLLFFFGIGKALAFPPDIQLVSERWQQNSSLKVDKRKKDITGYNVFQVGWDNMKRIIQNTIINTHLISNTLSSEKSMI